MSDTAGAPYKILKKSKQKRQNRRQSVVTGRQQLYSAAHHWEVGFKRGVDEGTNDG